MARDESLILQNISVMASKAVQGLKIRREFRGHLVLPHTRPRLPAHLETANSTGSDSPGTNPSSHCQALGHQMPAEPRRG